MQETTEERRRRCRHWFPDNKRCDNYQFAAFCEEHIQRTAEFFEYKDKSKREHKETSSTESVEDAEGNQSIVQERRRRCRHWFPDNKRCDNYQVAGFCEEHIKLQAEYNRLIVESMGYQWVELEATLPIIYESEGY